MPAWQEHWRLQTSPLHPALPHHHERARSDIPQPAQGNPQSRTWPLCSPPSPGCAHHGGGPSPGRLFGPEGLPLPGWESTGGQGRGEGGRSLRGFQPGNKTERTNLTSKYTITQGLGAVLLHSYRVTPRASQIRQKAQEQVGRLAGSAGPVTSVPSLRARTSRHPVPMDSSAQGDENPCACTHTSSEGYCGARGSWRNPNPGARRLGQVRPLTHRDTCTGEAKGPAGPRTASCLSLMPGGCEESGNRVPLGPTVSGAPTDLADLGSRPYNKHTLP